MTACYRLEDAVDVTSWGGRREHVAQADKGESIVVRSDTPRDARYDAVIFDLFGTLVDIFSEELHEATLTRMVACLGVEAPQQAAFRRLWNHDTWPLRATGQLPTTAANIRHVCAALGVVPDADAVAHAVALRVDFTRRALVPRADALSTLTTLRQAGYRLGLISDCSSEVPLLWPETAFAAAFDAAAFSCAAGVQKPDPAIYHVACTRLGVAPERCLYVGDGGSRELSGALHVGMRPVLISYAGEAESVIRHDADVWSGERISSLTEVLSLVRW